MKKRFAISIIAASMLMGAVALQADEAKAPKKEETKVQHLIKKPQTQTKASIGKELNTQKQILKDHQGPIEVSEGLKQTIQAINAIQKNDIDSAKKSLEQAHKSFEKALKADPKLKLVPIAGEVRVKQLIMTPEQIKEAVDLAKKALDKNKLQDARAILAPLEDDIVTATQFIPMDLYPIAAQKSLEALEKGKKDEALKILMDGLNTFVTVKVVMPIPLLEAQDLVIKASKLDKSKKDEAKKLLDAAKVELEKATLLGYTDKHSVEYKELTKQIDAIEDEIKGKNVVEKLYEKLKTSFEKLVGETRSENLSDSVEKKEAEALANPKAVKGSAEAEKKVESVEKKESEKAKKEAVEFKKEDQKDLKDTVSK